MGGGERTTPDVWYRYFSPADGQITVETCGSNDYNSVVSVWEGCPPGGFEEACDDDA